MKFYGVALEDVVVVHDEIDLDTGFVRVKQGGGHGGHNGLRSIIEQCGGNGFARVRVGVGRPRAQASMSDKDVSGWVLGDFPSAQAALVEAIVGRAADAVEAVVGLGVTPAMNDFNGKPAVS
jgi:PTH1 family peptidyl-tRNA hydrolase